jgi:hypothetical protein
MTRAAMIAVSIRTAAAANTAASSPATMASRLACGPRIERTAAAALIRL